MKFSRYTRVLLIGIFALALIGDDSYARGGRGGGGRGGGGGGSRGGGRSMGGSYRSSGGGGNRNYSRPSYSGNGSVRYSSPRTSSPSYSRPSSGSYTRPSYSGGAQRPGNGGNTARPASPAYQPAYRPSGGSTYRPGSTYQRPANSGSIVHRGSITTPGGSTIGGIKGPGGSGAVGIKGPGGGTAGAIKGPRGGGAAAIKGPGGATAGTIRGPRGGGAAGISGPRGGTAGTVWGPNGNSVVGARGRYGNRYISTLPAGAARFPWRGNDYWHSGYGWWRPNWVGDGIYYGWTYPPIGFYYPSLPDDSETVVIENNTYYESDGVYYQEGQENGKQGYVVAESPVPEQEAAEESGENPFSVLKRMCDYVSGLERFSAVAQTTQDHVGESGEKVQLSSKRALCVSRPDKVAIDVTSDSGARRIVYDGKAVSMLDGSKNYYTVVEAPGTIDAALDTLAEKYGIVVPMEDIMYKNLYDRMMTRVTEGQYLGMEQVDLFQCHHLVFSAGDSSWQVWVDAGDKPAPRKITIDYGQGAARSRYSAEIRDWIESSAFSAETFEFKLPQDAKRIELTPVGK